MGQTVNIGSPDKNHGLATYDKVDISAIMDVLRCDVKSWLWSVDCEMATTVVGLVEGWYQVP